MAFSPPRYLLLLGLLALLTCFATAEVVYHVPPPTKQRSTSQKIRPQKRWRLQRAPDHQQQDIVIGLYLTFGILFLLPILLSLGVAFVLGSGGVGWLFWWGVGLLLLSNSVTIVVGFRAGATATYSTRALGVGIAVFFGFNLVGGLLVLGYGGFWWGGAVALTATGIGLLVVALGFLIWGIFILRQGRAFRRSSRLDE